MLQAQAIMVQYQRILKCLTSLSPSTTHLCAYTHRHLCNLGYLHIALKQDFLVLSPHYIETRLFRFLIIKEVHVLTFADPKFLTHPYLHFHVCVCVCDFIGCVFVLRLAHSLGAYLELNGEIQGLVN